MNAEPTALGERFGLLERAVSYALGQMQLVSPELMERPTPCQEWDVNSLLAHMSDSLMALQEALKLGYVEITGWKTVGGRPADPVRPFRENAGLLLGAWANTGSHERVAVADHSLATATVLGAGAVEIAVHGWDVAQACGDCRPIPRALAAELLPLAAGLVGEEDRPVRFAAPVPVPLQASASDRLIAFLGRRPG